jgi:hypothetical protein
MLMLNCLAASFRSYNSLAASIILFLSKLTLIHATGSGPLLPVNQLVRSAKEDFRWKVPAQLAAEGAGYFY